jgi:DNA-3-methyladenine glycosylase
MPVVSPRIGIRHGVEHPWRWHVPHQEHVSKARSGLSPLRSNRKRR